MKKSFVLAAALILVLVTGCAGKERTLVCTKNLSNSTIKMDQTIDINFKGDKVKDMSTTITVNLPDSYKSYIDKFKENLDKEYKSKYGKYKSIKLNTTVKNENQIDVKLDFDYKNMTSSEKKELDLAGSEKYSVNKSTLEKQGFTCK